jgi:adenylate cyclase
MQFIANIYGARILVDISTKELIKDSYHLREVDLISYGQHSNLTLFEIMASTEDDTDHELLTTIISYELGLAEYRSKNWQAAIMHFKKSQTLTDDHPSKYMIERCRGIIDGRFELKEDWAGDWVLEK